VQETSRKEMADPEINIAGNTDNVIFNNFFMMGF
jgi:hypothetical protein